MFRRSILLAMLSAVVSVQPGFSALELGGQATYRKLKVKPLTKSLAPATRASFFRGVGGVAFMGVAKGRDGYEVADMRYDRDSADGMRLKVTLSNTAGDTVDVVAPIFDWQLIPILKFVNEGNHGCVSLFGELVGGQAPMPLAHFVASYHPAFDDTLLGLRLLQLDMLIIKEEAADLFKDGEYILGAGEPEFSPDDAAANRKNFLKVRQFLNAKRLSGVVFHSYVIGDIDQPVTFYPHEGLLVLTGAPKWHCWKSSPEFEGQVKRLQQQASRESWSAERLREEYHKLVETSGNASIQDMDEFGKELTNTIAKSANGINPIVYHAGVTTMRFSALLRHFKTKQPVKFENLIRDTKGIPIGPRLPDGYRVETPNTVPRF